MNLIESIFCGLSALLLFFNVHQFILSTKAEKGIKNMKMRGVVGFLLILQGCSIVGAVLDSKLPETSSDNQRRNTQRPSDDASLSGLGGEIDLAILNYVITGEKTEGAPKPQSCSDLSDTDKKNCINRVNGINEHIRKHVEKY